MSAAVRLAVIVTEFPKLTETFTYREAVTLRQMGLEVRIFYLTSFRKDEVVHGVVDELIPSAFGRSWLFGGGVAGAFCLVLARRPMALFGVVTSLLTSYWRAPVLLIKSLAMLPKCARIAEELNDWGASHVNASFAGHPATAAWIIRRLGGPAYSVTCHAHDIFRSQMMLATKFREAAFVRTISNFNADFLRSKLGSEVTQSVQVIRCGVNVDTPKSPRQQNHDEFTILFVGSLQFRKGVQVLLRALEDLGPNREWRCRIVGDGPMANELKAIAARSQVANRIEFLGPRTAEEVERQYSLADVLVTPSVAGLGGRAEGIPTVLMEGLSNFVPVVASNQTGIPELVRDGETGLLFEPGDHVALARCLVEIMENPKRAAGLAKRGYALVEQEFNVTRNMERFRTLVTENCDAGSRSETSETLA
jgi:colanic acid/amylovoran biosynthesis glycosyltransferase